MHRVAATDEPALQLREITASSNLTDLDEMTEEEFQEKFRGSPVKRTKWRGLGRNVAATLTHFDDKFGGNA